MGLAKNTFSMKYKVGDKVVIKSADWYYKNRDEIGQVDCGGGTCFIPSMITFCGQIVTISSVQPSLEFYRIKEDGGTFYWTDEMIEGIFSEENKPLTFGDSWECPQGYQFVDENGNVINAQKITLEKKEKIYPKTYDECCEILGVDPDNFLAITNCYEGEVETTDYERSLSSKFASLWGLLVCRDAYWKIAGEEMGMGKPWEPTMETVYCISRNDNVIECLYRGGKSNILEFPTPEMRDAFYENFKELIEICKELL